MPALAVHGLHATASHASFARGLQRRGAWQQFYLALHGVLRVHGQLSEEHKCHTFALCTETTGHRGKALSTAVCHPHYGETIFRDGAWFRAHYRELARPTGLSAHVALATAGNEQARPQAVSYRPHATEERKNPASTGD